MSTDMEDASNKGCKVVVDALEKMQTVQEMSRQTLAIVQHLGDYSEKSGKQAQMMDRVNHSVEQLLKLSEELYGLVNRFVTV